MLRFLALRILGALPILFLLSVVTFTIIQAPPGDYGDYIRTMAINRTGATAEEADRQAQAYREAHGLNDPLPIQYLNWVTGIVTRFDFGPSFIYKDRSVNDIIAQGFPVTLTYGTISFVLATIVGVAMGVFAALRHNTWVDYLAVGATFSAQALPNFVMAPILVIIFTWQLGWLPGGGWNGGQWQYVVMPVIALSTSYMASIARIQRTAMLEVLHSNFVRTARAKGLPSSTIIWRHAMKPALMPVVSYLGPSFVGMITGSVVIDLYFSTGGVGLHYVNAALNRDYAVMLGVTILYGALTILFNLVADIVYAWLDPKIRY